MARVLIAWEFGRNLGHIARDLPLARACREAGHEVVWAVRDLRGVARELAAEDFALLQAPLLRGGRVDAPPVSFADMLLREGYEDAEGLLAVLRGWTSLMRLMAIDVVVHDYAPSALIAARALGLPAMILGSGFMVPAPGVPSPGFFPNAPRQALQDAEDRFVANVNQALGGLGGSGGAPIESLQGLYAQGEQVLTTFEELDPFAPREQGRYVGPMYALGRQASVAWQGQGGQRVFAYLRPEVPSCEELLAALQAGTAEVVCAMPGLPGAWPARFPRLRFVPGAVDMAALLPAADLAITNGSGTIPNCLLAGVPVLVLPHYNEQYLAGQRLQAYGAGLVVPGRASTPEYAGMLERLLSEPGFRRQAQAFARRYAGHTRGSTARTVFEILQGLLPRTA
jgi:UDP:flavonoid glycosyltransferase YjiC (YdhE family)